MKKQKCLKCQRLTQFFKKYLYAHNKFVIESGLTVAILLLMGITCENLILQEMLHLFNHTT